MLQGLFSAVSVKVVMLISVSILIVVAIPATVAATARPHEDAEAAASSRIVDPERRDLLILTSRQQHDRLIEGLRSQVTRRSVSWCRRRTLAMIAPSRSQVAPTRRWSPPSCRWFSAFAPTRMSSSDSLS